MGLTTQLTGLDESDAESEPDHVEEDNRPPSPILNLQSFMRPRATTAALITARFRRWEYTP